MECNNNSLYVGKIPLSEAPKTIDNILDQLLNLDVNLSDYNVNFSINVGKYNDPKNHHSTKEISPKKQKNKKKKVIIKSKVDSFNDSEVRLPKNEEINKKCLICTKGNAIDNKEESSVCSHKSTCSFNDITDNYE